MIFGEIQEAPVLDGSMLAAMAVDDLEAFALLQPQVECPVAHHFGPGVYIREVRIPAGTVVVGHSHKDENLNIMLAGKMALVLDGQVSIVSAPFQTVAKPGRKAAYVLEDTVWLNVYATTETDIDKLEATYVEKSAAWLSHHEVARVLE